ncbi:MAG: glycosyltransferase family 2 protein [Elusimicrobiales bacterium]|nr:glycosyltransferase family 2 protein [Elusimicrobiales bacterium]
MKLISVVTACYNEEDNVEKLYLRVREIMSRLADYDYEHIFIDNSSADRTQEILRRLAGADKKVKVIINTRNFGHIRSPSHALMQAHGDAVISLVADFQDPPELIHEFVKKWEQGAKIVAGIKKASRESWPMSAVRRFYYRIINRLSESEQIENFTGFGLYDRRVMDLFRQANDPYPYFRGFVADTGFEVARVEYSQPARAGGITKNNFYTLYDMAMLGITSHSKLPLRLAAYTGFILALASLFVAVCYFVYKLIFWNNFSVGTAPLVIGLFFFASVQLFFIGIIGEYVGVIHTHVLKRPLVVEKERLNF